MTRAIAKLRLARVALACAVMSGTAASCIDNGRGSIFLDFDPSTSATFVDGEDGLRIRVELEMFIDSDGEVLLDSALVVVNHDGQTTSLPDPDIEAEGFPVDGSGQTPIALEVPSPVSDVTSFDAFCGANGRSVDLTLRFFTTSIDPDPELPPPVTEFSTNIPLTLPGQPEPPNVFGASGVSVLGTGGTPVVRNVVAGTAGTILFVVSSANSSSITAYRVALDNEESIDLMNLVGYPRLASDDPDVLFIAGLGSLDGLSFNRLSGTDEAQFVIQRDQTEQEYETFNVVALQPTATGARAAIISSFPLIHPVIVDPADGTPPEDKYYGSFIVDAAYADGVFEATAVLQTEREIVSWVPLADGMLQISNELPPRSIDTTLRIERLDSAGAVVWSHDEPVSGHDVDADALPDGTVLVAYELASGFVEVLRLAASDGTELARASFPGSHPTIAPYGADGALLSFTGRAPQEGVLAPPRPVPLLLELDASMGVLRGAQIACSGSADLQRATDGSLLLVGAFGERFSIGENVTPTTQGALILTKIAEPL